MRFTRPASDSDPLTERLRQVRALRIEAAGHLLEVRKAGAVLQVQQGSGVGVPGHDVRSAGELIVLVRLIEADADAQRSQMSHRELAHRRVNEIDRQICALVDLPAWIGELQLGAPSERFRDPRGAFGRARLTRLDQVHERGRKPRLPSQLADRPSSSHTGVVNLQAEGRPQARDSGSDRTGSVSRGFARRHSILIEHVAAYRAVTVGLPATFAAWAYRFPIGMERCPVGGLPERCRPTNAPSVVQSDWKPAEKVRRRRSQVQVV